MAGIQIGVATVGAPEGWVLQRQDKGGVLVSIFDQRLQYEVTPSDMPRVEAWLLGTPAKPALPDDVREYLRRRVRDWTCLESMDLLAKYPKE